MWGGRRGEVRSGRLGCYPQACDRCDGSDHGKFARGSGGGVKGASQRQVADRELEPEQTRRQW